MLHGERAVPGNGPRLDVRQRHARPSLHGQRRDLRLRSADEYEARLQERGHGDCGLRRAPRRDRARSSRPRRRARRPSLGDYRGPARRSHRAGRASERVRRRRSMLAFLEVPQECLILTMRQNQKYFPLFDACRKAAAPLPHRLEHESRRSAAYRRRQRARGAAAARGCALLLRPGPQDCGWRSACRSSQGRLSQQARHAARARAANSAPGRSRSPDDSSADAAAAERAAWLSKADLITGMVGEFPELQGVMGRYYALHDGEPKEVAEAIEAHYRPRFAGDTPARRRRRLRGGARRQARRARRHVRHRPAAHRREGSVRLATRCARA